MNDQEENDGVHIIPEQPKTEVYWNVGGGICLMQDQTFCPYGEEEEKPVLVFTKWAARDLVRVLCAMLAECDEDEEQAASPLPPAPEPMMKKPARKNGVRRS